ncbi:hypothetical protein BGW80DRAFT_1394174, partial [Lactifluus volemus]
MERLLCVRRALSCRAVGAWEGYGIQHRWGFFLYMGVGVIMEEKTTGLRVRGFLGWSWAMLWTLLWGMPMLDGWARH